MHSCVLSLIVWIGMLRRFKRRQPRRRDRRPREEVATPEVKARRSSISLLNRDFRCFIVNGWISERVGFDAVVWSWTNMCSLWDLLVNWLFDLEILAYGVSLLVLFVILVFRSVWFQKIIILWCFFCYDWVIVILFWEKEHDGVY